MRAAYQALIEAKLWRRIAKDPKILDNIVARFGGFKNKDMMVKDMGEMLKGPNRISRATKDPKQFVRNALGHKFDSMDNISMANPLKRATYFKVKHGNKPDVVGKVFIPERRENVRELAKLDKQYLPSHEDKLAAVKAASKDAGAAAKNALRGTRTQLGFTPSFKVFNKEPIPISRATSLKPREELRRIKNGTLATPSTIYHNRTSGNIPQQPALFAMPGSGGRKIAQKYGDKKDAFMHRVSRYKIPANKVIFGGNTIGTSKTRPEAIVSRQQWKDIR